MLRWDTGHIPILSWGCTCLFERLKTDEHLHPLLIMDSKVGTCISEFIMYVQALRELQALHDNPEVELAATAAMLVTHESAKVMDHDAIMNLSAKLEVGWGIDTSCRTRIRGGQQHSTCMWLGQTHIMHGGTKTPGDWLPCAYIFQAHS